jgi:hypothetical protein
MKTIKEVLEAIGNTKSRKEKIQILLDNDSLALKTILRGNFDDNIQFILPPGTPPYEPLDIEKGASPSNLEKEIKRYFSYIVKRNVNLSGIDHVKRERIFIDMLCRIHPDDAEIICLMKDKKIKYNGLTPKLVNAAWPGLLPE